MVFDFIEKGSNMLFLMVGIIMKLASVDGVLCYSLGNGTARDV